MTHVHVDVGGVRLHARLEGRAGAPAVVLVHSLGTDLRLWDAQVPALADGFQVLRFDLRGHGQSAAPPGPYTLGDLAQDLLGMAAHFGLGRLRVVGVSLGAQVALQTALQDKARVAAIAVCNTRTDVPPEFAAALDARDALILAEGMAPVAAVAAGRWLSPTTLRDQPALAGRVAAMVGGASAAGFVACTAAIRSSTLGDRFGEIAVPALFVASTEDPGLPEAVIRGMAARLAGSRYAEIPRAGHLSPLENPAAYNAVLLEFLRAVD